MALSTALRAWAGLLVPSPWIAADEQIYAELGRSLYETGALEILGAPTAFYSLVYPALIGLPLALLSPERGYEAVKVLQALVVSMTAVPVYLWGRRFLSPGWALCAAALTLTLPGLAYSGLLMSEVAFLPVVVFAAWALAAALARPSLRAQALAVGVLVLAILTRLQALALLPAALTAVVLYVPLARSGRGFRQARPHVALVGGMLAVGLVWVVWRLAAGGPASGLLGAYRAAGETSYDPSEAMRFILYHVADLVLLSGLLPACAFALIAVAAFLRTERSADVVAYIAVTLAFCAWFVAEVGVFASQHVGRLAERDLIALAPLLFLGFALWAQRGAPRPRWIAAGVVIGTLALVVGLPINSLTSRGALPDAFMLIPLYRLEVRFGDVNLDLLVLLLAVAALLLFMAMPRRLTWILPAVVGVGLAAVSISASRVVAAEATLSRPVLTGDDVRWIDHAARGPVTYLYGGEAHWNAFWANQFWNERLVRVLDLGPSRVPGPVRQTSVGPRPDGTVVTATGRPIAAPYVVASGNVDLVGMRLAEVPSAALRLWAARTPLRLANRTLGRHPRTGIIAARARVIVYGCRRARLSGVLSAPEERRITLFADGRVVQRLRLTPNVPLTFDVRAQGDRGLCELGLLTEGGGVAAPEFRIARE